MAKNKKSLYWSRPFQAILPPLLITIAVLWDTTVFPTIYNGIFAPNFTMALILAFSTGRSYAMGFAYAVIAGLVLDITTSYPVGIYTATLVASVLVASTCAFFERFPAKLVVMSIIYLLQESIYLMIAYAYTIRMEWAYLIPAGIRVIISLGLYTLLHFYVVRFLRYRGVTITRARRK